MALLWPCRGFAA